MPCYNGGMNIMARLHTFFSTLFWRMGISAEFFGFLVMADTAPGIIENEQGNHLV